MTEAEALSLLGVMANKTRLRIMRGLVQAGPNGMTAGDIAGFAQASPSRASFHLSAMADAGLVASKRDARQIIYRFRFDAIGGLIGFLLDDCCGGEQAVLACCGLSRSNDAPATKDRCCD